jgi:hypothetical protein
MGTQKWVTTMEMRSHMGDPLLLLIGPTVPATTRLLLLLLHRLYFRFIVVEPKNI